MLTQLQYDRNSNPTPCYSIVFPSRRLGVLVRASTTDTRVMRMGKKTKPVRLAQTMQEKEAARLRISRVMAFADMNKLSVPRSAAEWEQYHNQIIAAIQATKLPGLVGGSGYSKRWFARSQLVALMRHAGVERLTMGSMRVKEFRRIFPDAKSWMAVFMDSEWMTSVTKQAKYCGPPELFTMHLCLIGAKGMNFELSWLQKHVQNIIRVKANVTAQINMSPTPLWCCSQL